MKIAEAYGIKGSRVTERAELANSIDEMLQSKEAYILEVACQNEENIWPMVALGCAIDEVRLG